MQDYQAMKKFYLATLFMLLLHSIHTLAADELTPQAIIGRSTLKSIIEHNPHPSNTLSSQYSTTLIYQAYKKGATQRSASESNAIELEFDRNEILSAIKLVHFEPSIKN
ncbi:hypothetical protein [Polynucleobacter sp. es-MAR-4]|uniref:hypothetical protein n=1 Tax=Polynucleobacter sp. es-MAR-4 TaxID=1855655 RepID=UPI001C0B1E88|nr:hypothetical protein [Polynucleobacter sp. es-MAR-4]MBU3637918.1 hypothetical protein [Polynucleobacter sp. es-MAR-4]